MGFSIINHPFLGTPFMKTPISRLTCSGDFSGNPSCGACGEPTWTPHTFISHNLGGGSICLNHQDWLVLCIYIYIYIIHIISDCIGTPVEKLKSSEENVQIGQSDCLWWLSPCWKYVWLSPLQQLFGFATPSTPAPWHLHLLQVEFGVLSPQLLGVVGVQGGDLTSEMVGKLASSIHQ